MKDELEAGSKMMGESGYDYFPEFAQPRTRQPRVKLKFEYIRKTTWGNQIMLRVTFTTTNAKGIMYVRPDALPSKYGME